MALVDYLDSLVGNQRTASPRVISKPRIDVMDDGNVRGQDLNDVEAYEITVVHPWVDDDGVRSLTDWYATNKRNTIRIACNDLRTYDALIMGDLDITRVKGAYRSVRSRMRGNLVV